MAEQKTDPEIRIYRCKQPHKRAGMWTFSVDNKESLFYSSLRDSVMKKVGILTGVIKRRAVRIPTLRADGKPFGPDEQPKPVPVKPQTLEEFMRRGKLAAAEAE